MHMQSNRLGGRDAVAVTPARFAKLTLTPLHRAFFIEYINVKKT